MQRIEEVAQRRLIEKFSPSNVSVRQTDASTDPALAVTVDGREFELSRIDAAELRDALGETLARREEYLRTVGEHRDDGSYVVERRGAESTGHRKVFERFGALRALYDDLPGEFTAKHVTGSGVSGGRRHMLVRHFAEHPAFDCELVSRQPLTAQKRGATETNGEPGTQTEVPAD